MIHSGLMERFVEYIHVLDRVPSLDGTALFSVSSEKRTVPSIYEWASQIAGVDLQNRVESRVGVRVGQWNGRWVETDRLRILEQGGAPLNWVTTTTQHALFKRYWPLWPLQIEGGFAAMGKRRSESPTRLLST